MSKKRSRQFLGRWSKPEGRTKPKRITLPEIVHMFPDARTAESWFEELRWGDGMYCPRCGCDADSISECPRRRPQPYWCKDCRRRFSVRTGTTLEASKVPLDKWAIAIYLHVTSTKGISSARLCRDLGIRQHTAWFMLHRIREAWSNPSALRSSEAEIDEAYFGGKEKNKHKDRRLGKRWMDGKRIAVGIKDRKSGKIRAELLPPGADIHDNMPPSMDKSDDSSLRAFVRENLRVRGILYSDGAEAYKDFPWLGKHVAVRHSKGEHAKPRRRGRKLVAHTNGIESFWASVKRAYHGTFHQISPKHLQRYLDEFCARHNIRDKDTIEQMKECVQQMYNKRLTYKDLTSKK